MYGECFSHLSACLGPPHSDFLVRLCIAFGHLGWEGGLRDGRYVGRGEWLSLIGR